MRKKILSLFFALATSVGMMWAATDGKLSGAFSVSGTKVVYFSKGNLQATTNDQGATWTWGFAENQWDYVGNAAANTSFDYWGGTGNGSYDLFGWIGASSALTDYRQYGIGSNYDFTDCGNTAGENLKVEWGSLMGSDWRTLTYDEWQYLIKSRNNAANLLAYATVNGKAGLILLPDSWTSSSVALTITTANYTTNIISASDWSTLEEQGCVFLPAAGCRSDDSVSGVGAGGDYWSSSSPSGKQYDEGSAYCFFFDTDFSKQADGMHFNKRGRAYGLSVRLVSETAPLDTSYAVEFALGDAEGTAPAAVDVTIGEHITMPVNKTMYKAGYTLTGWSDGVNTYPIGESFTPANDVVLTPVFTANEADLLNASSNVTVKWYFGGDNGAPTTSYEGTSGLLVAQATIGDKTVDVKLSIDATSGKFAPQPTTEWAQVIVGTIFTYPYKEGMTVNVGTYSGNVTYYVANGNVTCGKNDLYSFIQVTYPASQPTGVEDVQSDKVQATKFFRDGQLLIEKNGKTYTITGSVINE